MRRSDREQGLEFSLALIDRCTNGVAAISTGEATPYCLPLSFVRMDNSLYFHCAKEGRKLDLLRRNPRVCVTFVGGDTPAFIAPSSYTTYFQSVIATGTASEVTDNQEKIDALRALCQKLTPNNMGESFDLAIQKTLGITGVWRIDMDNITGKAKVKK
ncbi:MAG: pyridoxamine 5'-phosphate oxidase family protein [Lawsonibacter sp.]|nr:pyridoxamine 5'-phosphate oxidase family protein [Lawsonibacter sp.]